MSRTTNDAKVYSTTAITVTILVVVALCIVAYFAFYSPSNQPTAIVTNPSPTIIHDTSTPAPTPSTTIVETPAPPSSSTTIERHTEVVPAPVAPAASAPAAAPSVTNNINTTPPSNNDNGNGSNSSDNSNNSDSGRDNGGH